MEGCLLMVFIKNPIKGMVKTRLAATIGDKKALEVYRQLLEHTLTITGGLPCKKWVFYSDYIPERDEWRRAGFMQLLQTGDDLGKRMRTAFEIAFDCGYSSVVIIGSDCYELTAEIIDDAFAALKHKDFVIGPATDGGYYLLGMNQRSPELFANKPWSTDALLKETIYALEATGHTYALLPALTDVDEEKDLDTMSPFINTKSTA